MDEALVRPSTNRWLFLHFPQVEALTEPLRQRQCLQQLAQLLYQDVAQIALQPPAGLLFEVRSLLRLYGSLDVLMARINEHLVERRVRYLAASGYSPLSAQLLAEAGLAVTTLNPDPVKTSVRQLPCTFARLEERTLDKLNGLGLVTLGQLLDLPKAALVQRFGKPMSLFMAQLRGDFQAPQHYYRPAPYFHQRLDLQAEIDNWQQLSFALQRQLGLLSNFLRQRQLSTRQLQLEAYHRDGTRTLLPVRFARDVWQSEEMQSLCMLAMAREPLPQPCLELGLLVRRLRPLLSASRDSFADQRSKWSMRELVARLRTRLGEQAVYGLQQTNDWRPERAWQQVSEPQANPMTARSLPRPLWLLDEPELIKPQDFILHWGPERLCFGWWDEQPVNRDYFIALDAYGRQAWLYQQAERWFLHGWFG